MSKIPLYFSLLWGKLYRVLEHPQQHKSREELQFCSWLLKPESLNLQRGNNNTAYLSRTALDYTCEVPGSLPSSYRAF